MIYPLHFFSNVVILVEGSSDKAILEEVANRYFEDNIQLSSTMALGNMEYKSYQQSASLIFLSFMLSLINLVLLR